MEEIRDREQEKLPKSNLIRFILLSTAGAVLFFVPVWEGNIPVAAMINEIKDLLGNRIDWIAVISSVCLGAAMIVSLFSGNKKIKAYLADAGLRKCFWAAGMVIVLLKVFQVPLPFLENPEIGGKILNLGATVFITIAVAGSLVIFIIRSGLVEFIAVLMEPIMRPVFRLPGEAAVNILSSFVSSASVGVYFSEQYYKSGRYTTRQVCSVVTSFSVISVGYIGVVASLAGISDLYGTLLAVSFLAVLIMGAIMIRIPPLLWLPDTRIDLSTEETAQEKMGFSMRYHTALEAGCRCAESFTGKAFLKNVLQSFQFAQKIVGVMIPTVTLVLVLVYYTPLFVWLGKPFELILGLAGVPDADLAAPSVLIGIVEVGLPAILIGGTQAAVQTRFFVSLLSIVQIIFFSEAGNAILASEIPLGFKKLVGIFLIRTAVGIPIAAFFAWLVCGL